MKNLKYCIAMVAVLSAAGIGFVSCLHGGKMMSITITPANPTIATGSTQQFTATAILSDGQTVNWTKASTWTSSPTGIVGMDANGLATSSTTTGGTGAVTITATDSVNGISSSVTLTVADPVSITVTPANPSIAVGQTQQFIAIATFSTTTQTQDLTSSPSVSWDSSDITVATISTTGGLATAVSSGTTTITANDWVSSVTGTAVLTVQ